MGKQNPTIVCVDSINYFTETDLQWSKKLNFPEVNEHSKYEYPHFYGDDLPTSAKLIDRRLIDISELDNNNSTSDYTQWSRASGNPAYKEIRQDIHNFGFKLKHPPIAVRQISSGHLVHLNGRTRTTILKELGFTNIIVDVYTMNDSDASLFGLTANAENDPAGDLQIEDVYNECLQAIKAGWLKPELEQIRERVERACGSGKFAKAKREQIITRIISNFDSTRQTFYWNSQAVIKNWMRKNNYIDTDNIQYMVVSHSIDRKAVIMAAEEYEESGYKEIRVVCHTGILDASDVEKCYMNRVENFKRLFNQHIRNIAKTYVEASGKSSKIKITDNIKLYGALPAVSTLHGGIDNMNKLISFEKNKVDLDTYTKSQEKKTDEALEKIDNTDYQLDTLTPSLLNFSV